MLLKDQGVDTVTLDVEVLKPEPVTVYHKHARDDEYILSRSPVPEYRLYAESILQHCRFEDRSSAYIGETKTGLSLDTIDSIISDIGGRFDRGFITRKGYKFRVNRAAAYTTEIVPISIPMILLDQRFPTAKN